MAEDLIRYDVLVQEATRGVIRKVLTEVARAGLPGDHHFFIAFDTSAPGVRMSSRLKERFPEEITIVLQHQFWDLTVNDTCFEVGLSFGGVPEKLLVPFNAIKAFFDPSVETGFQFDVDKPARADAAPVAEVSTLRSVPAVALKADETAKSEVDTDRTETKPAADDADPKSGSGQKLTFEQKPDAGQKSSGPAASVVSLDQFRKKT